MQKKNIYWQLFTQMFLLSSFTFGGGYVIISLMKKKFVNELQWIDETEMLNLTAIAQSAPGPVAVNASILLGYKLAKLKGAFVCILGTVLPPLLIISVISFFYDAFSTNPVVAAVLKGMQAGVSAVIMDVVVNLGWNVTKHKDAISILVMLSAFIATYFFQVNIILIVFVCGAIGAVRTLLSQKEIGGEK